MNLYNIILSIKDDCFKLESEINLINNYSEKDLSLIDSDIMDPDLIEFVLYEKQKDIKMYINTIISNLISLITESANCDGQTPINDNARNSIISMDRLIESIRSKKFYQTFDINKYRFLLFTDIFRTQNNRVHSSELYSVLQKLRETAISIKTEIDCTNNLIKSYSLMKYLIEYCIKLDANLVV